MKIKELKALIAELPDDMEVVVSGQDHSYDTTGSGQVRLAEKTAGRYPEYLCHVPGGESTPVKVFWIDDGKY